MDTALPTYKCNIAAKYGGLFNKIFAGAFKPVLSLIENLNLVLVLVFD